MTHAQYLMVVPTMSSVPAKNDSLDEVDTSAFSDNINPAIIAAIAASRNKMPASYSK